MSLFQGDGLKFTMIVPVFNAGEKLLKTVSSIAMQSSVVDGTDSVDIIVVDGGSTDTAIDGVRALDLPNVTIVSERDGGMYDALAKGLIRATGDVVGYLPAGEVLEKTAFRVLGEILTKFPHVDWITGLPMTRNSRGDLVGVHPAFPYRRSWVRQGIYGTILPAIQQESTFWRRELTNEIDLGVLRTCKLAGDFYIWKSFARAHDLFVAFVQLSSFSVEPGQLSKQVPGAYRKELRSLREKPDILARPMARVSRRLTKYAIPRRTAKRMITFDHATQSWVMLNP